ncbi:hypothetical protein BIV60_12045 [Bacillus sp. MUM 116]|nr:hypothetical protein BIV60_12045 [Bacillus sp. MUM 116]
MGYYITKKGWKHNKFGVPNLYTFGAKAQQIWGIAQQKRGEYTTNLGCQTYTLLGRKHNRFGVLHNKKGVNTQQIWGDLV